MTRAFTDGASRGNPGRGGWGAILITDTHVQELGGREDNTTNNRMEMRAAIEAIRSSTETPLTVVTDSAYLVNGATKWIHGWKQRDWKTSQKEDVLNVDLWQELDELLSEKSVSFELVKGHVGIALNERADVIATTFADKAPTSLYNGPRSEYRVSLSEQAGTDIRSSKRGRDGKAYSYVSFVNGKLSIDKTWSECEARVKGARGARFKKALTKEEEDEIVQSFTRGE